MIHILESYSIQILFMREITDSRQNVAFMHGLLSVSICKVNTKYNDAGTILPQTELDVLAECVAHTIVYSIFKSVTKHPASKVFQTRTADHICNNGIYIQNSKLLNLDRTKALTERQISCIHPTCHC